MISIWIAVIILVASLFYIYCIKPLYYWKNRGVKQASPLRALWSNWFDILQKQTLVEFFSKYYYAFPGSRYYGMYQFNAPALFLKDPELIKQITIRDFEHFINRRTFIPEDIDPLWGKNLFALTGQRWRDMRVILSPSFTGAKIKGMFFLMNECAKNFVQYFLEKEEDIVTVEMKDVITRYCNDVIASTAFGVEVDSLKNPNNEFYLNGAKATDLKSFWKGLKFIGYLISPTLYRLFGLKLFSDDVSNFFNNIIDESIKLREEKGIVRQDLVNLMMEARKGIEKKEEHDVKDTGFATVDEVNNEKTKIPRTITNEDITAQAMIFFFAGFESVSSLMCFMAHELAVNPDVQDMLRNEVAETNEKYGDELKYDVLVGMKYMDMVVSESLRKWPSQVGFDRVCTKSYTIQPVLPDESPLILDKGSVVVIPVYNIQNDSQYYPDPDRFDPERFNEENKKNLNIHTYHPFGIGPRNCIGSRFALLEVKAIFFHILLHFEITPVERTSIPLKLAENMFTMDPSDGFWLGLKRNVKN